VLTRRAKRQTGLAGKPLRGHGPRPHGLNDCGGYSKQGRGGWAGSGGRGTVPAEGNGCVQPTTRRVTAAGGSHPLPRLGPGDRPAGCSQHGGVRGRLGPVIQPAPPAPRSTRAPGLGKPLSCRARTGHSESNRLRPVAAGRNVGVAGDWLVRCVLAGGQVPIAAAERRLCSRERPVGPGPIGAVGFAPCGCPASAQGPGPGNRSDAGPPASPGREGERFQRLIDTPCGRRRDGKKAPLRSCRRKNRGRLRSPRDCPLHPFSKQGRALAGRHAGNRKKKPDRAGQLETARTARGQVVSRRQGGSAPELGATNLGRCGRAGRVHVAPELRAREAFSGIQIRRGIDHGKPSGGSAEHGEEKPPGEGGAWRGLHCLSGAALLDPGRGMMNCRVRRPCRGAGAEGPGGRRRGGRGWCQGLRPRDEYPDRRGAAVIEQWGGRGRAR